MASRNAGSVTEVVERAAVAELATVEQPQDAQCRLEVVELYRQAELLECARAELTRLWQQFPKDELVLAAVLDMMREQRSIPVLLRLVNSAANKEGGMSPVLRLALARAFTALAQFEKAADQYTELMLVEEGQRLAAEHVAEFTRNHADMPGLVSGLMKIRPADQGRLLSPLLQYAVFRASVEGDRSHALTLLEQVPLLEIDDPDIVFDVAVQSFRLGRWDWAAEAADRVRTLCPNHKPVARLLVSAHSFAGRLHEAGRNLWSRPERASPLRIESELLATLFEFAEADEASSTPRCAVFVPAFNGDEPWNVFPYELSEPPESVSDLLDEHPGAITGSVIGRAWREIGPWEVLAEADLVRPHLMAQHVGAETILHAFVSADTSACWSWEEVPMAVREGAAEANGRFRWLASDKDCAMRPFPRVNALWPRVDEELKSIRIAEEEGVPQ